MILFSLATDHPFDADEPLDLPDIPSQLVVAKKSQTPGV